jgi:S-adenosylmethionine uptake transporter
MPAATTSASRTMSGAALAMGAWAAFSLQDAIVKYLVVDLPVPEVLFARSLVIVALASLLATRADFAAMVKPRHGAAIALRSLVIFIAWVAYYRASRSLQLAEMVTFYFAAPLFVVAMSGPLLREAVGAGRWLTTIVGFGGVVIAANPTGATNLNPALLALFAALCWAITTLLARSMTKGISTAAMMVGSNLAFVVACGALAPALFVWPGARGVALMAGLGCVGGLGQFLWFEGVRRAQASLLAPLEYVMLAYAVFWGWLFFGDLPGGRTLLGAAIILASGLATLLIEARRHRIATRG